VLSKSIALAHKFDRPLKYGIDVEVQCYMQHKGISDNIRADTYR
jgi:hypothetical protein